MVNETKSLLIVGLLCSATIFHTKCVEQSEDLTGTIKEFQLGVRPFHELPSTVQDAVAAAAHRARLQSDSAGPDIQQLLEARDRALVERVRKWLHNPEENAGVEESLQEALEQLLENQQTVTEIRYIRVPQEITFKDRAVPFALGLVGVGTGLLVAYVIKNNPLHKNR